MEQIKESEEIDLSIEHTPLTNDDKKDISNIISSFVKNNKVEIEKNKTSISKEKNINPK